MGFVGALHSLRSFRRRLPLALGRTDINRAIGMEHLVLLFRHGIRDVIPYCQFIAQVKLQLTEKHLGEYIGDDMAIDGGDAEAVFASSDVRALYEFLAPQLRDLPFMREAEVKLIFGPLEGNSSHQELALWSSQS